jgi:hypothetical protein
MPTINPASDRTSQKRYCLTAGNGSSNCCSGPVGPPGPTGTPVIPGSLWNILYNDGAASIAASPLFAYNIASDNLAFGEGTPGVAKNQLTTHTIAIGSGAGATQANNNVAIGYKAGYLQSAGSSIAIGAYAGVTQTASSIILNAGGLAGATMDGGITGFFVSPVRSVDISANAAGYYPISYKSDTRELVYNPVGAFKGYVAGVIECNPGPGATSSSVTVTNIATPVTYLAVSQQVGGITFTTGTTGQAGIILPVTGLYEVTSILQCDVSGSPTNVTAWHSQNGVAPPTGARTVSVSSAGTSILTTSHMFRTVAPNEYVQLMITTSGTGATAQLTSLTRAYGGITTTDPAVMTTVKLVG